jgi:mxaL protein
MKARVGWPFAGLAAAAVLTLLAWADPRIPLERPVFRYLFVLDITQSMNTRDYHLEGLPADRLGFAKAAIRRAITDLPCGSQAGLGLFTTQNVELLFEPLEVCRHAGVIEDVLEHVDWRMAWAADSFIAQGLNAALRIVKKRDPAPRLVFLSDGQQTPEDPVRPELKIKPGEVQGLIVGVGDVKPVPIPRLDRENRPLGFWEKADILAPVTTTAYLDASADTSHRRGNDGSLYLSWLHETELRDFADTAGLGYLRLDTPERLSLALRDPALGELRVVPTGIGWTLALIAWLLVIWPHLVPDPRARHVSG